METVPVEDLDQDLDRYQKDQIVDSRNRRPPQ
jgi:hypothetical protein